MKLIDTKCSNCGALIKIEEGKRTQYCTYCGNQIILDTEETITTTNIKHTYSDEAKVKQIEAEHELKMKQLETERELELKKEEAKKRQEEAYKNSNKILLTIWAISLGIFLFLGIFDNAFWGVMLIDFIIGLITVINRTKKKS